MYLSGHRLLWVACALRGVACKGCNAGVHLTAPGLLSMVLHYVTVKTVGLIDRTGMHKTGCSGETRLILHVPGSSWAGQHLKLLSSSLSLLLCIIIIIIHYSVIVNMIVIDPCVLMISSTWLFDRYSLRIQHDLQSKICFHCNICTHISVTRDTRLISLQARKNLEYVRGRKDVDKEWNDLVEAGHIASQCKNPWGTIFSKKYWPQLVLSAFSTTFQQWTG